MTKIFRWTAVVGCSVLSMIGAGAAMRSLGIPEGHWSVVVAGLITFVIVLPAWIKHLDPMLCREAA